MNAKPNSIELMPAALGRARSRRLPVFANHTIPVAWAAPVLFEVVPPPAEPGLRLGAPLLCGPARDIWEALSFATLWFCGWIGVGLCFVEIARF